MRKLSLLILLFLLISTNLFAKPLCKIFYEKLENEYSGIFVEDNPIIDLETYGFDVAVYFDEKSAHIISPGDSKYKEGDYVKLDEVRQTRCYGFVWSIKQKLMSTISQN